MHAFESRIIRVFYFFEKYAHILTYSILAYAYPHTLHVTADTYTSVCLYLSLFTSQLEENKRIYFDFDTLFVLTPIFSFYLSQVLIFFLVVRTHVVLFFLVLVVFIIYSRKCRLCASHLINRFIFFHTKSGKKIIKINELI